MKEKNKTMGKEKALEICDNLTQTINKMTDNPMRYEGTMFQKPSVTKATLRKIRKKLSKKYNLSWI